MTKASDLRIRLAALIRTSHPASRLLVGLICLAAGVHSGSLAHALPLLATTLLLLLILGTPVTVLGRALKVLAFLVLPILILHMWLTPGRVVLSLGRLGDISAEGLARGGWLSLHLVLMYFSAMLFSRLVSLPEWMVLTAKCGGRGLQPYLMLLLPLVRQVRWRTQLLARQWRRRGTWRELALTLSAVMDQCMAVSRQQADALWLRWPVAAGASAGAVAEASAAPAWSATVLMLLIGAGVLAYAVGGGMSEADAASRRIALVLEYDGAQFNGWQRQKQGQSVQESLEHALHRIDGADCRTVAAGRTDAGVHAEAMLVHADVDAGRWQRSPRAYMHGVNQHLPPSLRVVGVRSVHPDFHARFDCRERAYRYQIWNRPAASALHAWRHWWMPRRLSVQAMNAAASFLLGEHDFSAFRAAGCQAHSAVRELRQLEVAQDGWVVSIDVRANAFLYHMVRNIVGSLVRVGIGDWRPEQMRALLEAGERSQAAATAPAHGLYFRDAVYEGFRASELVGIVSA